MTVFPDNTLDKIQSLGHIEQSASVDPRVSRKNKRDQKSKNKRRRFQPTISEQLEEEQSQLETNKGDNQHIDFHA